MDNHPIWTDITVATGRMRPVAIRLGLDPDKGDVRPLIGFHFSAVGLSASMFADGMGCSGGTPASAWR
jgi:hypothetical protein